MSVMHIQIPDDLRQAFETAFPGETVEAFVARMMREAISRKVQAGEAPRESLVDAFKRLSQQFPPMSDEEIRAARAEGRS